MRLLIKQFMAERKIGTGMAAILVPLLAACGPEAGAQQATQADRPEPIQVAAVTAETRSRTMAECRALADRTEKIACMTEARDALRAENAAKRVEFAEDSETIAANDTAIQERLTTVEGLTKGLEIAENLQAQREQQER